MNKLKQSWFWKTFVFPVSWKHMLLMGLLAPLVAMAFLLGVFMIPDSMLEQNAKVSAHQIFADTSEYHRQSLSGTVPKLWRRMTQRDFYTDAVMIGVAMSDFNRGIVERTLNTRLYASGTGSHLGSPESTLVKQFAEDYRGLRVYDYSRYWHGYLLMLRPLLMFLDYHGILIFNYMLLNGALLMLLIMLYRKLGWREACCFLVSVLAVAAPMVPMNCQFMDCFFIAYAVSIYILCRSDKYLRQPEKMIVLFFVTGMATSFFDFLTTPVLTLCLPLGIWVALQAKNGMVNVSRTGLLALVWFFGYVYMWASKWILTCLLTSGNIFYDVYRQIMLRSYALEEGQSFPMLARWMGRDVLCCVFLLFLFIVYVTLARKRTTDGGPLRAFLMVGFLPLVWFFISMQHSFVHMHFTWRAASGSFFAFLMVLVFYTSPKMLWSRLNSCSLVSNVKK